MVSTGIVRRIDDLGRVVIPREIRNRLNIREGDPLEIFTDKNMIIFRKYCPLPDAAESIQPLLDALLDASPSTCFAVYSPAGDHIVHAGAKVYFPQYLNVDDHILSGIEFAFRTLYNGVRVTGYLIYPKKDEGCVNSAQMNVIANAIENICKNNFEGV